MIFLVLAISYSVSLALYFLEIINRNNEYGDVAYRLLFFGGVLQTLYFTFNLVRGEKFPLITMFEVLFLYSLLLIFLVVLIYYFTKWILLELITVFFSLLVFIGSFTLGETLPIIDKEFLSKLLFVHILIAVISYSAFFFSAIFSGLYLIHDYLLKKKIWNAFIKFLPSIESLVKNSIYTNFIGICLLFTVLVVGSIWASLFFSWTFFLDPKVIISFIILSMYSFSLINSKKRIWTSKQAAIWNVLTFLMVLINLIITYLIESFHRWS